MKKDRKGLTGIMDAVIFMVLISMAFSALYVYDSGNNDFRDASDISDEILSARFSLNDVSDYEDSKIVCFTDLLAVTTITNDEHVMEYLVSLLDSTTGMPGSYKMTITYMDNSFTVGTGSGIPRSSCIRATPVVYGDSLTTEIELF
jgi:hypothetical protein